MLQMFFQTTHELMRAQGQIFSYFFWMWVGPGRGWVLHLTEICTLELPIRLIYFFNNLLFSIFIVLQKNLGQNTEISIITFRNQSPLALINLG